MSIYATGGATIEALLLAVDSGQAGTYRISIIDTPAGTSFLAPTTSGISEVPAGSGIYAWSGTAPSNVGQYAVIWDAGTNSSVLGIEDLFITQSGVEPVITSGANLCTLAQVRAALEMPSSDTTRDTLISQLIAIYSRAIMNEVHREFAPVTGSVGTPTTRRFKLEGGHYVVDLEPYDLQTVSSVTLNPETDDPTTLTVTDDFQMQPITKSDGVWTSVKFSQLLTQMYNSQSATRYGYALVDIAGVWGFPSVPEPVRQACILAVTSALRRDISAFAMDIDEAVQLATDRSASYGLPPASRRLLDNYRRNMAY